MSDDRCKACGRTAEQHKGSEKKTHEWPRIMCNGKVDPKWTGKKV